MSWTGLILAVVGGDDREAEILRLAAETGATVRGDGFPATEAVQPLMAASAEDALDGARFAAFPIPGLGTDGALFAPAAPEPIVPDAALLMRMAPSAHIILGTADDRLRAVARATGIGLHEYETDPQLMLERMPAIVEGALHQCIAHTDVTISGATVAVVGRGNVGAHLSRTLRALGADVHVFARNPVQRASAGADGTTPHELRELETLAGRFAMVFSTVPAQVVGGLVLERLAPDALVMDLAAPPGGVNRERAAELNISVVWARGLGRRAHRTVGEIVGRPLRQFFGTRGKEQASKVVELLERVHLRAGMSERQPAELSGGEKQRVAIARALAASPDLLLCDEVCSALDVSVQAGILELLTELRATLGVTLVFVTHDLAVVRWIASRVVVMQDGVIRERGQTDAIFEHPRDAYTRELLGAVADLQPTDYPAQLRA